MGSCVHHQSFNLSYNLYTMTNFDHSTIRKFCQMCCIVSQHFFSNYLFPCK